MENISIKKPNEDVGILNHIPQNKNILYSTHYIFNISRISTVSYFCQEVELPGARITAIVQPTIFNPIKRPGGAIEHDFLRIKFLVDEKMDSWKELFNWINECSDYVDFSKYLPPSEHFAQNATVFALNSNNQPQSLCKFTNLFPVSLGSLKWKSTDPRTEQIYCDAMFAFTSYEINNL